MRVQKIDSFADLTAIAPHWDRLVQRSGYRLPFSTFSWSASWWRHFGRRRYTVRDRLSVRAVWDDRGELAAVAPFMLTEKPGTGPVRMRWLHFIGGDFGITEVSGMVALPDLEREACAALLDDLQPNADQWHWIRWSGLNPGGIAAQVIEARRPLLWSREVPSYILTLPPSWEELSCSLPRNIKESLRKCYNSLRREGHAFVFVATERAEEMRTVLSQFFRLHRARADLGGTVRHSNLFTSDDARQFLIEICETLAQRGATRVFALHIGGRIVAMRIGFILGDTLYLYYSGYDPAWSKYGVMTTVVAESIKYAIAAGLRTVNLSTGKDVSKTRWRPSEVCYREAIQLSPSLSSHAAHAVYRLVRRGRRALAPETLSS